MIEEALGEKNEMALERARLLRELDPVPLVFVAGKGGVGKSTVALNFVLRALERGKRTLHVVVDIPPELDPTRHRALFASFASHYTLMNLNGKDSFREYVLSKLPGGSLVSGFLNHAWFEAFVSGAPGLKELVTLGKLVFELQSGKWEKIVVDLPASGHAFEYLKMPIAAAEAFRQGLVGKESGVIVDTLRDRSKTALLPVAIPEELSRAEAEEFLRINEERLKLHIPFLVVNKVAPALPIAKDELQPFRERLGDEARWRLFESAYAVAERRASEQAAEILRLQSLYDARLLLGYSRRASAETALLSEILER